MLTLFEGVASGAADGYGRMTGAPAATLLHLGPGLGNAFANLHNAYKARTPMVNLVGDHAVDAQAARRAAGRRHRGAWRGRSRTGCVTTRDARSAAGDAALAAAAAQSRGGGIATLILPADAGWSPAPGAAAPVAPQPRAPVPGEAVDGAERALRSGGRSAILLGGHAHARGGAARRRPDRRRHGRARVPRHPSRAAGARRRASAGASRCRTWPSSRSTRWRACEHLVVAGTQAPVGFFAYPGKPSRLTSGGHRAARARGPAGGRGRRAGGARRRARRAAPRSRRAAAAPARRRRPAARSTPEAVAAAVGAMLPERAIVVDESVTLSALDRAGHRGRPAARLADAHRRRDRLGLPVATGAAVACPDRPVLSLEGDGSAMYTIQSLWTQAREGLDVTTRDHGQPLLRDPRLRALPPRVPATDGRGRARADRDRPPRPRLHRARARHGRSRRGASSRVRTSSRRCARRSPSPART